MTVCTNHVALCHLVEDALPIAVSYPARDRKFLVPEVVELEHHRVLLAAIHAGMFSEKRDQVLVALRQHGHLATSSLFDIPGAVRVVVLLLVRRPAGSAVVVALTARLAPPREFVLLLLVSASPASAHSVNSLFTGTDVPFAGFLA